MTKTPGPARGLLNAGIALADTKPTQAATDPVGESISRRTCGAGSRSTFIVPGKAGNRGHRDPLEGREVSPGQTCGYDTRGNSVFHYRVNVLAADSRAGVQSFGFPPVVPGPVPGAKLPGEEPDALMRARPALRGGALGNDAPYSAPRKPITRVLKFFKKHQHRMRYAEVRARGMPIGSGAVESSNKVLIKTRMKGAGMRWSENGTGQPILTFRALWKSGRFDAAWRQISRALEPPVFEFRSRQRHNILTMAN